MKGSRSELAVHELKRGLRFRPRVLNDLNLASDRRLVATIHAELIEPNPIHLAHGERNADTRHGRQASRDCRVYRREVDNDVKIGSSSRAGFLRQKSAPSKPLSLGRTQIQQGKFDAVQTYCRDWTRGFDDIARSVWNILEDTDVTDRRRRQAELATNITAAAISNAFFIVASSLTT